MNIMTKRGNLDNIVTYESICDTKEDLTNIPKSYATLGSIALVIKGDDDMLEAYMATSEGEWVPIMINGDNASGSGASCDCPHLIVNMVEQAEESSATASSDVIWYNLVGDHSVAEIYDAFLNGSVRINFDGIISDIVGMFYDTEQYLIQLHTDTLLWDNGYIHRLSEYLAYNNLGSYLLLNEIPCIKGSEEYPTIRHWKSQQEK